MQANYVRTYRRFVSMPFSHAVSERECVVLVHTDPEETFYCSEILLGRIELCFVSDISPTLSKE